MVEVVPDLRDDEVLWRRVAPEEIKDDGTPQSSAFNTQNLSVHRSELTTLEAALFGYVRYQLWAFSVADAKGIGLAVEPDPPPLDHALVKGLNSKRARRLRNLARRVHPAP